MATDGVHVDRAQSNTMNLEVLKRQDAGVMELVDTASQSSSICNHSISIHALLPILIRRPFF
ncbi:hypothetical protein PR003_g11118 [Phytophthora rubi]|uniref:Uncharacterized protein n=1 Tax=Phytophthora rubi TaxID=129364 RepID=A0A6A4F957_9STRA|nr:hypothetical protein PR003_g11118 [Phytophthora rubi]